MSENTEGWMLTYQTLSRPSHLYSDDRCWQEVRPVNCHIISPQHHGPYHGGWKHRQQDQHLCYVKAGAISWKKECRIYFGMMTYQVCFHVVDSSPRSCHCRDMTTGSDRWTLPHLLRMRSTTTLLPTTRLITTSRMAICCWHRDLKTSTFVFGGYQASILPMIKLRRAPKGLLKTCSRAWRKCTTYFEALNGCLRKGYLLMDLILTILIAVGQSQELN